MQDLKKFTSVYENTRVCTSEVFVRSRWMTTTLDNVALSTNSHGLFSYVVSISAKVRQLVSCCGIVDLRRNYFVQTTHVNSCWFTNGGQGSAPHIPSTGYAYAWPLSVLPLVAVSGALSRQILVFLPFCAYHPDIKYPQYSAFQSFPSHSYRPAIII